ncbi:MAG TPA: hypothetical protein VGR62_14065, partial [Candidatus Binatia bacterium]|nr:hypothetical protein [Candidatus Binatia bacterium]
DEVVPGDVRWLAGLPAISPSPPTPAEIPGGADPGLLLVAEHYRRMTPTDRARFVRVVSSVADALQKEAPASAARSRS